MAGVSLIKKTSGIIDNPQKVSKILDSLNHIRTYSSKVVNNSDGIIIGYNIYAGYPIKIFDNDQYQIIIEGKIYNKDFTNIDKELNELINDLDNNTLAEWLLNADGDFIIFIYNKIQKTLYIFNDILGRLPVYYYKNNDKIIVSRYIKFITDYLGNFTFDKIGFGEYLLFGYLIGERTLFTNINQLRPASIITIKDGNISVKAVHTYNFQNRIHKDKCFDENITNLSELFSEGCRNRFNNGQKTVLSLSGGLDSRTIASCLSVNKISYEAVTLIYENEHEKGEAEIAKKVADYLNIKMTPVFLTSPSGEELFTLLKIKEGMNYLATAPMLIFYKALNEIYTEPINLIFGEKPDKISIVFDNPTKKITKLEDLADYIIGEHSFLVLNEICLSLNLNKENLVNDLRKLLSSYPEEDLFQRYVHFRAIEKSHKLAFQGDDRHKRYFWSYSPLTSSPFVNYLFNIPNKEKKMHRIFIGLLNKYSPGISSIIYPNFKAPITSFKAKLFMASVYYLYPKVPHKLNKQLKNIFFGSNTIIKKDSVYYKILIEQIKESEISKFIDVPELLNSSNLRTHSLHNLLTLTSLIEYFRTNKSTLSQFADSIFDYKN